MLTSLPSGRLGRVIAAGGTLFLVLAVWLVIVSPLLTWYRNGQAELAQREASAARMAALAAQLPALLHRADSLDGAGKPVASLLPGDTDALAAATLQQNVQTLAATVGITPTRVEILPAVPIGHYRRIALHLSLVSRFSVVIELLQSVARARPRMLVDDLELEGGQLINQPVDTLLQAELTICAYRAADDPATAPVSANLPR